MRMGEGRSAVVAAVAVVAALVFLTIGFAWWFDRTAEAQQMNQRSADRVVRSAGLPPGSTQGPSWQEPDR